MMKYLGIIDLETTGLDPQKDHVIEVAFGVYSVQHAELVKVRSWLVKAPEDEVHNTHHVHNIPPALVTERGVDFDEVTKLVGNIATKEVDVLASYNAKFDSAWLPPFLQNRPWICLCNDVEYVRRTAKKDLLTVAHAHGVQIGTLHRATDDVLLCARLLTRCAELGLDLDAALKRAMRPKKRYRAVVSYDTNTLAKTAGFSWDKVAKVWWKDIAEEDVPGLGYAFEIQEMST